MADIVPVTGEVVQVPLEELHYRYIPQTYEEEIWHDDMGLPGSPHVELMRLFLSGVSGWQEIKHTRYVKERQSRRLAGMVWWTNGRIREHLHVRMSILKSLSLDGYREQLAAMPVRVLEEPFWKTRYMNTTPWVQGPELWDGGGRCAAAYALGWKEISAVWVKDPTPGLCKSRIDKKLENVKTAR